MSGSTRIGAGRVRAPKCGPPLYALFAFVLVPLLLVPGSYADPGLRTPSQPAFIRDTQAIDGEPPARAPPVQVWRTAPGPSPLLGMGARDRLVFASTSDGRVHALDALLGAPEWAADLGGRPLNPFPAPDYLLVSGETVYGLEYGDGRVKWELPKDGSVYSPVFFRSDSAYVAKNDRLMSLAPINGSVKWVSDPLGSDLQPPSSAECCTIGIYISGGSDMFGREVANGKEMWKSSLPGQLYRGPLAIVSRLIFGADDSGNLRVVSEINGSQYASESLGAGAVVAPVAIGDRLLFALEDGSVAKWSVSEMKEVWRTPIGAKPSTSPAPLYDHVWVGTSDGRLLALKESDGSVEFTFHLGAVATGRLASFYGMVMATTASEITAFDAIPLGFQVTSLADNQSVSSPKVRFAGTAVDDFFLNDVEVSNGSGWTRANVKFTKVGYAYRADWESEHTLSRGWNELKARTVGNAGKDTVHREIGMRVFLDEEAPALNIDSPADGYVTQNKSVTLTGTASDSNGLSIVEGSTDHGKWIPASGLDNWTVTLDLRGGTYDATVRARDLAGHVSERTIRVTSTLPALDTAPPFLWLEDNRSKIFSASRDTFVHGTAADDIDLRKVEVSTAGGWARCAGTWAFACTVPLPEGSSLVKIRAFDTSGNNASSEIVVAVDLRPPIHSVSYPPPGLYTNQPEVAIRGNTTDDSGVEEIAIVIGNQSEAFAPSATQWETSVRILPGANLVRAIAKDLAGNVAMLPLNLTLDTKPPTIVVELLQPHDTETKVFGSAGDDFGIALVQASGDGGATWTDATGRESWFVTLSGKASDVLVRAIDLAGNEGRAEARTRGTSLAGPAALAVVGVTGAVLAAGLMMALKVRRGRLVLPSYGEKRKAPDPASR